YLAAIQVSEFLIIFAYAGIAAAFIAPRLSALLSFFFGIDTTSIFSDVTAVIGTVAGRRALRPLRAARDRGATRAERPAGAGLASVARHLDHAAARVDPILP